MANILFGQSQGNQYPVTPLLDDATKMPTRAWQQWFLNLLNFSSSATATTGTATLPAKPAGFMNVTVGGKPYKVPYYNP
jgi:hypothetical protein